ncbi:MAG: hypothetical protein ABEI80_10045 [Haloplanus sp.]
MSRPSSSSWPSTAGTDVQRSVSRQPVRERVAPFAGVEAELADRSLRTIDCAEAKIVGDVVWATPNGDEKERVIPVPNVTGATGDDVEQDIEEVEFPGGRVTEHITYLS